MKQTAAVILRRCIAELMEKTDKNTCNNIKACLLNCLDNETVKVIRKAIALLVVRIARDCESHGAWEELLNWINLNSNSDNIDKRKTGG